MFSNNKNKNELLGLRILTLILFFSLIFSIALAEYSSPSSGDVAVSNTEPALNISSTTQNRVGSLGLRSLNVRDGGLLLPLDGGRVGNFRIGVGKIGELAHGLDIFGDASAGQFCLGSNPPPIGCISRWSDITGPSDRLSGGIVNRLVKWSGAGAITSSSISDDGLSILIPKTVQFLNEGTQKGLTFARMNSISPADSKTNIVLALDATGNVILARAVCR